jgi:hypothetical protein
MSLLVNWANIPVSNPEGSEGKAGDSCPKDVITREPVDFPSFALPSVGDGAISRICSGVPIFEVPYIEKRRALNYRW